MMRGDSAHAWSNPLRSELDAVGIDSVDVEAALQPLKEPASRFAIALARLAENRNDSIAWWALLRLTHGIARNFEVAIAVHAAQSKRRFGNAVLSLADDPPPEASRQSLSHASGLVGSVSRFLSETDTRLIPHSDLGFGPWFVETAQRFGAALSDEASQIALQVGAVTPQDQGISHFLNQLEPVTKDQALRTDGIAIMPMTRSKGLTFRAAIVMGVENGIIPSPRNEDEDEERRLLYVAMTRPTEFLYLTMATRRTGPTARSGRPRVMATRSRSPFFRATTIKPQDGRAYLRRTQSGVLT
jgi:DNA helicase-2/ATP-dependent DNA helicase PcrA